MILNHFTTKGKEWGVVYDKKTGTVQPLATIQVVRMVDEKELLGTKVLTDHLGRYFLILGTGTYYMQVMTGEEGNQTVLARTGPIKVRRGDKVVTRDITI